MAHTPHDQVATRRAGALRRRATIDLDPVPPFAFDATFHKPDHFPTRDTAWEAGTRWQTMRLGGHLLGLRIEDAPPRVRVTVFAQTRLPDELPARLAGEVAWRANLGLDLTDFERRARRDRDLAPVVE